MTRIIDQALRGQFPNMDWPTMSVLHIEVAVPKRWTNKLAKSAGTDEDPFVKMKGLLEKFLQDKVELIGFRIED